MKNLVIAIATLSALTAPALAGKASMNVKKKAPVVAEKAPTKGLGMGDSFDLVPRHAVQPTADLSAVETVAKIKTLTDLQVSSVVSKHTREIQHCWNKLPAAQRVAVCSVMLKLDVEANGKVSALELSGDVPAGAHKCISQAALRWQFPVVEEGSEVETGISLRGL